MQTTMDLLHKALTVKRAAHWASELELSSGTLTNARQRGRLSPTLAGNLAMKLGENPVQWIAVAAMEAEPESSYKKQLLSRITLL